MKRKLYMMIGLPGSGKSTLAKIIGNMGFVLDTDSLIEYEAKRLKKTYSEVFKDFIDESTRRFKNNLKTFSQPPFISDVVIDQTNLTAKARKPKLDHFKDFEKIAIVVQIDKDELLRRNNERKKQGRNIPEDVLLSMLSSLEMPKKGEFDKVIVISGATVL